MPIVAHKADVAHRILENVAIADENTMFESYVFGNIDPMTITYQNSEQLKQAAMHYKIVGEITGLACTDDEAIICAMLSKHMQSYGLPGRVNGEQLYKTIKKSKLYHKNDVVFSDPYLVNIKLQNINVDDISVLTKRHIALTIFPNNESSYENKLRIPSFAAFDPECEFCYPYLKQHGEAWMNITPEEINTAKHAIHRAKGNVLTLGLGLGYFSYICSLKNSVNSVTVIESNESIIDLFKEYILPQFSHKEKIKIIHADAFDYMNNLQDGKFNFCFADIWKNWLDIDIYIKLKDICKKFKRTEISYWIENELVCRNMNYVSAVLIEEITKGKFDLQNLFRYLPLNKNVLEYFRTVLAEVEINKISDADYYFVPQNIIKLLNKQ